MAHLIMNEPTKPSPDNKMGNPENHQTTKHGFAANLSNIRGKNTTRNSTILQTRIQYNKIDIEYPMAQLIMNEPTKPLTDNTMGNPENHQTKKHGLAATLSNTGGRKNTKHETLQILRTRIQNNKIDIEYPMT